MNILTDIEKIRIFYTTLKNRTPGDNAPWSEDGLDPFEWVRDNAPYFTCPDPVIENTYAFRWWAFGRHLRHTADGHVVTEFLPKVSWSGKHNTISCAAGHHLYEARWLRNPAIANEYAGFWFRGGGNPSLFSFWAADASLAVCHVHGDSSWLTELYPDLLAYHNEWIQRQGDKSGLVWSLDTPAEEFMHGEGMEYSIGGSGLRPFTCSVIFGEARALGDIAALVGRQDEARNHYSRAERIKSLVQEILWDPGAEFFKTVPVEAALDWHWKVGGYKAKRDKLPELIPGTFCKARELIGYVPWYFNLPDRRYNIAWRFLTDPRHFAAPYGITTAEQGHPRFNCFDGHDCYWNGPVWPYATTQTLRAMANLLHSDNSAPVTRSDYLRLLHQYARSHELIGPDGRRVWWLDEHQDPFTGEWIARRILQKRHGPMHERGIDYNHSGFCDLVLSGLVGICPRSDGLLRVDPLLPEGVWKWFAAENIRYHGHDLTIIWDQDGKRFGCGTGLQLIIDGEPAAQRPDIGPLDVDILK